MKRGTTMQAGRNRLRVAVVGVGALGSEVCLQVAANAELSSSVSAVDLIDPDGVAAENFALSRLFAQAQRRDGRPVLGAPKAEVAALTLQTQTPYPWVPHVGEVADLGALALSAVDVLVCCADSALARAETTLLARLLGLPLLDSGVRGEAAAGGRVAWFPPAPEAACYGCGLSAERRAALLQFAEATTLGCHAPDDAALGEDATVSPSLVAVAAVVVEHLRALAAGLRDVGAGTGLPTAEAVATRLWPAAEGWTRERVVLRRSPACPWHETGPAQLVTVQPEQCYGEALRAAVRARGEDPAAAGWRLQFVWPVCVLAVCRACGVRSEQPRRLAALRQRSRCIHCGSASPLEPLRTVASVGQKEWMAKATPRQLGWAEPQLVQLRREMVPGGAGGEAV